MSGGGEGGGGPGANDGGGGGGKGGGEGSTGSGQGGQGFVAPTGPGSVSGSVSAPTGFVPLVSGSGSFDANGGGGSTPLAFAPSVGGSGSQNSNPLANLTNPAGGTSSAAGGGATGASTAGNVGGVQDPTAGLSNPNAFVGPQPSPLDNPNTFVGPNTTAAAAPSQLTPAQLGAPPPPAPPPAPPPPGGGDNGGLLDKLVKGAGDSVTKNPLGAALSAGGLGYQIFQGQQQSGANQTIADQANSLNAQGKQLAAYLQSGDLPPGLKASLTQATEGAKAKVIQNFANQGLSTDPTKNSALQQQLAAIDQQAIISTAQIGQQLLTTGINESGMASDLYKKLSDIDATQTAAIGKAIASMASALNGGGGASAGKTTVSFG